MLLCDAEHIIRAECHILGILCFHARYNTLLYEAVHLIGGRMYFTCCGKQNVSYDAEHVVM